MSRLKALFAGLVLSAIVGAGIQSRAQSVQVMVAGSSAMWQTMALGTYNKNACPTGSLATPPCFHYTAGGFNLTDTRPTTPVIDGGTIWIVWDSAASPKVWAYIKVDSVVGNRCYFAVPACNVNVNPFPAPGNKIVSALWGDGSSDTAPPSSVTGLFTGAGVGVNVAATDIRPEDAAFAECRVNSILGAGASLPSPDNLDGLGYNSVNASGTCPKFSSPAAAKVGNAIVSGLSSPAAAANVLAFNLSGTDPFTNKKVPLYTTVSVGAAPITFVFSRSGGQLHGLADASDSQLQEVFSGANCDASALGLTSAPIQAYLREPLSGTMNTTEATVFRRPIGYTTPTLYGVSQESNVNGSNPLNNTVPCLAGAGFRWRGIGTGEVVGGVQNSVSKRGTDGIAYTFFSYGNVSGIANSSNYGYITLNTVDPIFTNYAGGDPGQPVGGGGVLPAAANLPASCAAAFPCSEKSIWTGGLSFPHLRDGTYRAWSILRIVSTHTALSNMQHVIASSQSFVVTSVPDYVPYKSVTVSIGGKNFKDPGLKFLRSHYQQLNPGDGSLIGKAPVNFGGTEAGGDMGGCILASGSVTTQLIQVAPGNPCATR